MPPSSKSPAVPGRGYDFATLVLSVRHRGRSVGQISAEVLGPRTRPLFLLVILFLVFLVIVGVWVARWKPDLRCSDIQALPV
jgi:carbon starvation protein CstA